MAFEPAARAGRSPMAHKDFPRGSARRRGFSGAHAAFALAKIQCRHLDAVRLGIDAKTVGNGQARMPEAGKVRCLGPEAVGIRRVSRGRWNDERIH